VTPKQERFVAEYLIDLNATQAAIRAGYSEKAATAVASRMLTDANVATAVREGKARQLAKAELSAARVLEEYRRVAFFNVKALVKPDGSHKQLHELTDEESAALAEYETIIKNAKAGDGHVDEVLRPRPWNKLEALRDLAKHFSLLVEKQDINVNVNITTRLQAGRKRVAALRGKPQGVVDSPSVRVLSAGTQDVSNGAARK
jgi:phage terminase small subunit